ncbi:MAG TPA: hypothetical protein VN796_02425 [Acidimicrobiales bacterium]|nr:hypothetical protein [Acidimicrobiales bacterium]
MSVFLPPTEGVHLEDIDEPLDIRVGLRQALLEGADWREGFSSDICIGVLLWERWRPALEPAGMDREAFVDVVVGDGRELWLWLMGERQWDEFLVGLAGRVRRRLPAR